MPAITSQLVFNFFNLFLLDIVIICSADSVMFYLWRNIPTYLPSDCEKILGVKIDYKLNFDEHVKTLCSKANNKLTALARTTPYMSVEKKKILMNSFFNAQFNYCSLVWMLHSHRNNNIIRNLHERCLRLIYNDENSSYEELLTKDGSVFIHHRNVQALATEFYKIKNGLSPELFTEILITI